MVFAWQTNQWQQLWRAKQAQRLPHALLFAGIAGIGKAKFADDFARALLCRHVSDQGDTCEACHDCRLVHGKTHPNLLWIEPEKVGQAIKVDQIREVTEFINQSSLQGEYRIVIINPANAMNTSAANALLKTLEEPSSGAIIILLSQQNARLPATILSRCQRIVFPRPNTSLALQWLTKALPDTTHHPTLLLKLAHGAPLDALQFVQSDRLATRQQWLDALCSLANEKADPIAAAQHKEEGDLLVFLDFVLSWLIDLIQLQTGKNADDLINEDYQQQLRELAQHTDVQCNINYMDYLQQLRAQLCSGINLNKQLMMENVFIRWRACLKTSQLKVGFNHVFS